MLPYRLAAIDVDGTLVGPDLTVSDANRDAIQRLASAGITILLASGRSHANIVPFYRQLQIDGLVVSVHGAVVRDSRTGEYLLEEGLTQDAVRVLSLEARRRGVSLLHYRREGVCIEARTPLTNYEQSRNFEPQALLHDLIADTASPVHKLVWLDSPERILELTPVMQSQFGGLVNVTHTDPEYLEFTSPSANKAEGVAIVCERMGIAPDQVLAFGDGNNDIPLLAWAGLGIAMPHASEGAKAAANSVSAPAPLEQALAAAIDSLPLLAQPTCR